VTDTRVVVDCPLCGFNDWAHSFAIDAVRVRRCRNCGLSRAVPAIGAGGLPSDVRLADSPPTFDANAHEASEAFLRAVERGGLPPSPLLAVVERGHPLPELARRRGWDVEVRDVEELEAVPLAPGRFGSAIVIAQLERSRNPIRSLEVIHDALAGDGVLLAAVTSLDHPDGGVSQQRWRAWRRDHRYDFNRHTLESALLRSGFAQVSIAADRQDPSLARHHARRGTAPQTLRVSARQTKRRSRPMLSIVVPVYNEKPYIDATMTALLNKAIPGVDNEIIVVESNSTDGTREAVLAYEGRPGVRVILEDRPLGKGHAVRTGLKAASGDIVMIQDADCEYDFDDYEDLLKPLLTYRKAFVLGSRHTGSWKIRTFDAEPGLVSFLNLGHSVFVLLLNVLYRQTLKDPFTMYKVFRRDCVHGLKFECDRFDFDFELVIKMVRKGYTPIEIPVNYKARSWAEGKKVRFIRDPLTWIRALVKYRFVRIFEP
jgi:hypothetical protein